MRATSNVDDDDESWNFEEQSMAIPQPTTGAGMAPVHTETSAIPPPMTSPIPAPAVVRADHGVAGKKGPPATKQGACIVCLTSDVEVLDADWLHEQGEGSPTLKNDAQNGVRNCGAGGRCQVSACLECLKSYFEVRAMTEVRLAAKSARVRRRFFSEN